jgi:alkanesulfonate monooxygenase SsuD/methylene tetrahydromethanopterin reductase-like flavin-dependent oxidoreductase (luciferase family)
MARIAERGKLDMLFSGDGTGVPSTWQGSRDAAVRWGVSWPRQDLAPLSVAMARVTKHLGFGVTYSTTFMHPYYLARLFNSLDHVTGGRIAFNVITSTRRSDYANYGYDEIVDHDERYDRMEEFIDVCRTLWDSVEPDAMLWDHATGQVGDPAKVHDVEHRGKFFKVSGPLNTPPSPQGRPLLLQAGGSPRGIRAAAYVADMAFGADMPLSLADRAARGTGRGGGGARARSANHGHRLAAAHRRCRNRTRGHRPARAPADRDPAGGCRRLPVAQLRLRFRHAAGTVRAGRAAQGDHRQPGLAGRLRARADREAHGAGAEITRKEFFEHGMRFATGYERTVAGTAAQVADRMEEVFEATGSRGGFMLGHVVSMPGDLTAIVDLLVPELQRRGRFRTEYKGTTLRDNLFDD